MINSDYAYTLNTAMKIQERLAIRIPIYMIREVGITSYNLTNEITFPSNLCIEYSINDLDAKWTRIINKIYYNDTKH